MIKKRNMYKRAGCVRCNSGQIISDTCSDSELSVIRYSRCPCSRNLTEEYQTFLDNSEHMTVRDYFAIKESFIDNYSHIETGNNVTDRSW